MLGGPFSSATFEIRSLNLSMTLSVATAALSIQTSGQVTLRVPSSPLSGYPFGNAIGFKPSSYDTLIESKSSDNITSMRPKLSFYHTSLGSRPLSNITLKEHNPSSTDTSVALTPSVNTPGSPRFLLFNTSTNARPLLVETATSATGLTVVAAGGSTQLSVESLALAESPRPKLRSLAIRRTSSSTPFNSDTVAAVPRTSEWSSFVSKNSAFANILASPEPPISPFKQMLSQTALSVKNSQSSILGAFENPSQSETAVVAGGSTIQYRKETIDSLITITAQLLGRRIW